MSPELHILLEAVRFTYFKIVSGEQRAASKDGTQHTVHSALDKKETNYPQRDASRILYGTNYFSHDVSRLSHGDSHRSPAASSNFDVERLLRLAAIHKLRPVLLAYDKEFAILPSETRQQLEAVHQRQVMRNLKLTQVFLEVSKLLSDYGIEVLPMKGNLLIHTVYGNQQLRETGDVDILLRRRDVIRAVEVLKQLDFRLRPDMNPQTHKYQDELVSMMVNSPHQSEIPLTRGSEHLDVHWSAAQPYYGLTFSTDEVLDRAQQGNFFNSELLLPSPEDAIMLTLIHHGGKEHWRSLRHLLDFALLMNSEVNIPQIREKAREVGVQKAFDTGCQLLREYGLAPALTNSSPPTDPKYTNLIKASWENTTIKTARDHWFGQFPTRMRGNDSNFSLFKAFQMKVIMSIASNQLKSYPQPFGFKQTAKKATKLFFKLVSGKGE